MEVIEFLNIKIEVRRRYRARNLTLRMYPEGLWTLCAARSISQKELFRFLDSQKSWIEKQKLKLSEIEQNFKRPKLRNSELFPFLGEMRYFQFVYDESLKKVSLSVEDGFLICRGPKKHLECSTEIWRSLKKFYQLEAQVYLKKRLSDWSEVTGLRPKEMSFRSSKRRWGSCSSAQQINLNWKLICQPPQLIDYVIVHELCHLRYLNHSTEFWNLVESILPSYRESEKALQLLQNYGGFLN